MSGLVFFVAVVVVVASALLATAIGDQWLERRKRGRMNRWIVNSDMLGDTAVIYIERPGRHPVTVASVDATQSGEDFYIDLRLALEQASERAEALNRAERRT